MLYLDSGACSSTLDRKQDYWELSLVIQVPYILRYCWGVEIATFHHVLRSPWSWFHEAALRGNLFGSGCIQHGQASPVLQPHEELGLLASSPQGLSLGPSPRNSYPLVDLGVLTGFKKSDES